MWSYEKDGSLFVLVDDQKRIHGKFEEISILFQRMDGGMPMMHKHGSFETCSKIKKQYSDSGLNAFGDLEIITSRNWKVDTLNRILNTTGYLSVVLKNPENFFEENDPFKMPK